jgi:hypothetical protein
MNAPQNSTSGPTGVGDSKHRVLLRIAGILLALIATFASYGVGILVASTASHSALALSSGGGTACGAAVSSYVCGIVEREQKSRGLLILWRALADFGLVCGALWVGLSGSIGASGAPTAWPVVPSIVALWTATAFILSESVKRSWHPRDHIRNVRSGWRSRHGSNRGSSNQPGARTMAGGRSR